MSEVWMSKDGEILFIVTPLYSKCVYEKKVSDAISYLAEHFDFFGYHLTMHDEDSLEWDASHGRVITDEALNRVAIRVGEL